MSFLANLDASVVDCNSLQGMLDWHRATTIELNNPDISDLQLEQYYYEFNGGLVPMLEVRPYRQKIINGIFDQLAVQMNHYSMDHWLVAKQVIGKGWSEIVVMVDMITFQKCGEAFQKAWLNAVMIPDDIDLPARRDLFPFPDGYTDIGPRLSEELLRIDPSFGDWHTLGTWLSYRILLQHRFNTERWKGQIGFLLRNIRIDVYVTDTPLNYINHDNHRLGLTRDATMTQGNTRLDGTVTKGSGTTGNACSSLDGRDGMPGGQQKRGQSVEMTPINDGFNWNNMSQFTPEQTFNTTQKQDSYMVAGNEREANPPPPNSARYEKSVRDSAIVSCMNRNELQDYCTQKGLPDHGTTAEVRARATTRALDGSPEAIRKLPPAGSSNSTEQRWWPTILRTNVKTRFDELKNMSKLEGYNYLYNQGISVTNANDWSDEDIWTVVWSYMIPVLPTDVDGPSEDGRFLRTIQQSATLGMTAMDDSAQCELKQLKHLKVNAVVRIYYRSLAALHKNAVIYVRYMVAALIKDGKRLLKIIDQGNVSADTPDRGLCPIDQLLYVDLSATGDIAIPGPAIVIPTSTQSHAKEGQAVPLATVMKRRQMNVSHLFHRMRSLDVISQNALLAGEQIVQDVALAIIVEQGMYAQVTTGEVTRLLSDGLQSLDLELWLPRDEYGDQGENFNRAYAHLCPAYGLPIQPVMRNIFRNTFTDVEALMRNVFTHYVNLLRLKTTIKDELGRIIRRSQPIFQGHREQGRTKDNLLWATRQIFAMIERTMSLVLTSRQTLDLISMDPSTIGGSHGPRPGGHSQTEDEVLDALSAIPNFTMNHALADELDRRQRGEITTGDGYQIPKADKPASVVEVNAVLKEVGRNKRRNNRNTSRGGGDKGEDKNNKEMKPNPASDNKASATKKQPTSQVNQDIDKASICTFFISSRGCYRGTGCTYAHRMPADPQEAKDAKQALDQFNYTWSAEFRDAYMLHHPTPATTTGTTTTTNKTVKKGNKRG